MAEILIPDEYSQVAQQQEHVLQKDNSTVVTAEVQPSEEDRVVLQPTKLFEVTASGEVHTEWVHKTPMSGSVVYAFVYGSLDGDAPEIRRRIQAKLWGVVLGIPTASWLK